LGKKRFHYHFIFILDSRDHSQEIKLAQQIGQIWEKVIGAEGTFHNCHFKAVNNQYDKLAIGRLHRHEQQKYQYLLELLRYFAKKDQFILHKNIGKARTLGTSIDKDTEEVRCPSKIRSSKEVWANELLSSYSSTAYTATYCTTSMGVRCTLESYI
jgi:hypothetical protein